MDEDEFGSTDDSLRGSETKADNLSVSCCPTAGELIRCCCKLRSVFCSSVVCTEVTLTPTSGSILPSFSLFPETFHLCLPFSLHVFSLSLCSLSSLPLSLSWCFFSRVTLLFLCLPRSRTFVSFFSYMYSWMNQQRLIGH